MAQGDFDAFLRADTNERAGLLEKVTGTGLYRAVSVRIFERTETARQAHDALAQQHAGYQILSVEGRGAMEAEVLALNVAGREDALRSKSVKEALDRHARLAETTRQLVLAEDMERQALAAQTNAADERDWLSRIDRAAPLRAPWQSVQGAVGRLDAAQIQVVSTCLAAGEAAAKATKEAEFKAFGPIWDKAAALDSQITSALSELEAARASAIKLEQDAAAGRATLASLRQEESAASATKTGAAEKLANLSADSALADDWPQIAQRIADHADAQLTLSRAEAAAGKHEADVARLDQMSRSP